MKAILKKILEYLRRILEKILREIVQRFALWASVVIFVIFVSICLLLWYLFGSKG
ncbi:MAG: hypothetical protein K2X77_03530 [Candidatus Obscuribacterales bacterium]|nr:hypothetical protein [Candidatus Obscuribacterales bacterium]